MGVNLRNNVTTGTEGDESGSWRTELGEGWAVTRWWNFEQLVKGLQGYRGRFIMILQLSIARNFFHTWN